MKQALFLKSYKLYTAYQFIDELENQIITIEHDDGEVIYKEINALGKYDTFQRARMEKLLIEAVFKQYEKLRRKL